MANDDEPRAAWLKFTKRQLPRPYDRDLSGVLRHLNRRTRVGRYRIANDPVTAGYLCAGMRLLERHFGPGARQHAHVETPLLGFVSQRAVAAEVSGNPAPFPRQGTVATLRDRWGAHANFIADLINFAVWLENYRPGYRAKRARDTELLVNGPDFVRAVLETAYRHTAEGLSLTSVRFSLALMTTAAGDGVVGLAVSRVYQGYLASWKELYATVIRERGLRLRPGLTLDDLADALSAATDGAILRAMGDPDADVVDHVDRRSVVGPVALALVHGFLEPEEEATGLSLEQAVRLRFDGRPA
ncbi:hypothetical protein [Streptacidiphilus albus]|uniref:hypothetical protein n=1 Tax=Streptacidiphilus albus TaxID=105425 RepID=UPI00054B2730|nr:hypothetical protein [Streptacidiphilus albus]